MDRREQEEKIDTGEQTGGSVGETGGTLRRQKRS